MAVAILENKCAKQETNKNSTRNTLEVVFFLFGGKYNTRYCSWFRNPVKQLRLVLYLLICRVLDIPGGAGFHQQYGLNNHLQVGAHNSIHPLVTPLIFTNKLHP